MHKLCDRESCGQLPGVACAGRVAATGKAAPMGPHLQLLADGQQRVVIRGELKEQAGGGVRWSASGARPRHLLCSSCAPGGPHAPCIMTRSQK